MSMYKYLIYQNGKIWKDNDNIAMINIKKDIKK
jgi:hypothetical protein